MLGVKNVPRYLSTFSSNEAYTNVVRVTKIFTTRLLYNNCYMHSEYVTNCSGQLCTYAVLSQSNKYTRSEYTGCREFFLFANIMSNEYAIHINVSFA